MDFGDKMIVRLKAKNQITIPMGMAKGLKLKRDDLFEIKIKNKTIQLLPVELKSKSWNF